MLEKFQVESQVNEAKSTSQLTSLSESRNKVQRLEDRLEAIQRELLEANEKIHTQQTKIKVGELIVECRQNAQKSQRMLMESLLLV